MTSPTTDRRFGLVGNAAMKAPVTVAASGNITLSGQQTIDGIAVLAVNAAGVPDRVLCVGQTDSTQNGIWDVSTAAWTRSIDADGKFDLQQGSTVLVNKGASHAGEYWRVTSADPITIGTTALTWGHALAGQASSITFLQAGTGAVERDSQSKMRDRVSVKDFGVKGDGSNESATLAKVFTAVVAQGFSEVDLCGLTITLANGTTLTNASNVVIKNGTLQGLLTNTTGFLLTLSGCTNVVLENVTFNAKNSLVSGQQLSGASVTNCSDVLFELCRFPDVYSGVITSGTANYRIRLSRCMLVGPLAYSAPNAAAYLLAESLVFFFGPSFESGVSQCYGELVSHLVLTDTTSSDIYAVDNVVKNSHDTAIYFYCPGALATGNKIYYAGKDGIKDNSTSGPGARFTSNYVYGSGVIKTDGGTCIVSLGSEAVMSNNVIYLLPLASRAAPNTVGIVSYNSNQIVDANVITADSADTSNNGIILGSALAADAKNISISNNVLTGVYEAIKWGQPSSFTYSNINISGNRIRDCTRGIYGFLIDTGYTLVNQVVVVNNTFTNYSDSAIVMTLSSDVVVSGNRGYVVGGTSGKFFNNQGSHNVTFTNNTTDGAETTFLVEASSPTYLARFGNMKGSTPQSPSAPGRAYTTAARPAASTVALGAWIWNTTTNKPNWSDGTTNWYDAAGTVV